MDEAPFLRVVCEVLQRGEIEDLLRVALDAACRLAGAQHGCVVVREGAGCRVRLARGDEIDPEISTSVVRQVFESGRPVRVENALKGSWGKLPGSPSVRRLKILSILAVPIRHEEEVLAVLYLDNRTLSGIFGADSEDLATRFAREIAPAVRRALHVERLAAEDEALRRHLDEEMGLGLLGAHPSLVRLLEDARRVAPSDAPVLIQGESGTGKELLARSIHRGSSRRDRPWVVVHCGALAESLLESELFGHVRGAFTGATSARDGRFKAADGGTIFLDEVAELTPAAQVKLLRVIQSGEIQPVGADVPACVDVRVVAASHESLPRLVAAGRFREDLYYRLGVITLEIPPLRERGDDAVLLAEHFVRRFARIEGKEIAGLSEGATASLEAYPFPGNVRELENVIRRAVIFARGRWIEREDLPAPVAAAGPPPAASPSTGLAGAPVTWADLRDAKEHASVDLERRFVEAALRREGGNVSAAARTTGVNRSVLHRLMALHGLDTAAFKDAGGAAPDPGSPPPPTPASA